MIWTILAVIVAVLAVNEGGKWLYLRWLRGRKG